jgi:hypothetical protein
MMSNVQYSCRYELVCASLRKWMVLLKIYFAIRNEPHAAVRIRPAGLKAPNRLL